VASHVPLTRVEKVDDAPRHGEVPGTEAYVIRTGDAVPDEVEVLPEGSQSRRASRTEFSESTHSPVPQTRVERVDSGSPSYGEIPGTEAYEKRRADAVPDLIFSAPENDEGSTSETDEVQEQMRASSPVPETLLSKVETLPDSSSSSHPRAHHRRSPSDALPDTTENLKDAAGESQPPVATENAANSSL
jgi:hypothetical protein